jgi:sarcosine oxidase
MPGLEPAPVSEVTCLYTSTETEDFVLDRVGPVVVASPCSGHGFKFAPTIGRLVADLVMGAAPVPRFSLAGVRT